MQQISIDTLGSPGYKKYVENKGADWCFLESGYFHVDEGDHHMYYRVLIEGSVWEMLEQDMHKLYKMTPIERRKYMVPNS